MNEKRILALADLIEATPHTDIDAPAGFNMDDYSHYCGTPSCIAGYACAMRANDFSPAFTDELRASWTHEAADFLDLDLRTARRLFEPNPVPPEHWKLITSEQAVTVLRTLAETGEVDWSPVAKALT